MKFMLVIYNDPKLYDALPAAETDGMMRDCLAHADELRRDGCLQESQMLEDAQTAKSVRIRGGRTRITDGPFSETKEVLGGLYLIEAASYDEAVQRALSHPHLEYGGTIEVRPVFELSGMPEESENAQPAAAEK